MLQTVTFRLADSVPMALLLRWQDEFAHLPPDQSNEALRRRIEFWLDRGSGEAVLRDPGLAEIVADVLRFADGHRYRLHAWVVMPNHVHVLFTPRGGVELAFIVGTWKGLSAKRINKRLGRHGALWQRDYFDRVVRDPSRMHLAAEYIENNPVKAGLCGAADAWRFGSAFERRAAPLTEDLV